MMIEMMSKIFFLTLEIRRLKRELEYEKRRPKALRLFQERKQIRIYEATEKDWDSSCGYVKPEIC